tara:strand:+ start:157 stop:393 length:237 start_codon:yes stop_codon:yes gene_type:complete
MKHFGRWLISFCNDHHISQRELSDISGIQQNVLHGWRKGRTKPNGTSLAILATTLSRITKLPRPEILEMIVVELLKDS